MRQIQTVLARDMPLLAAKLWALKYVTQVDRVLLPILLVVVVVKHGMIALVADDKLALVQLFLTFLADQYLMGLRRLPAFHDNVGLHLGYIN